MTKATTSLRFAAAALLAIAMTAPVAAPAFAAEAKKKEEVGIDRRATGSIAPADMRECADNDNRLACRMAGENRGISFPSAPINPSFGF